jgi:hypothetical protein
MRTISWILAAVVFSIAAPHAQDAGRTPPVPPAPAHNTMVLTGCLAAGSDDSTFKLTNATPNAQASASQPQSVATSGERAEYELKAEKNLDTTGLAPVELKSFVGRQVEITARAGDEPAASAPPKADGDAKGDPDPSKPIEKKMRSLTVTAIKQVLAACR